MRSIMLCTILLASVSCTPTKPRGEPAQTQTLTVLAAASLTGPFSELGSQFEAQYPNTKVEFNFAGSQQLAQQLSQGAPADVFASASQKNMDTVVQAGRVAKAAPQIFAKNRLVLIYPKKNSAGLAELKDLARPGLKLIFAAQDVPAGQYSLDFLDKASNDPAFGAAFKAASVEKRSLLRRKCQSSIYQSGVRRSGRRDCILQRYHPRWGGTDWQSGNP